MPSVPQARHLATGAGAMCFVLFVLINVSDWPGGFMNEFWLDHAIVGATAGTVLLAATVFLIYRYQDQQQQELVDESVVDAGRTELVDRLVEVDVALSLLCAPIEPDVCRNDRFQTSAHGLAWLREHLDEASVYIDSSCAALDPRLQVLAPQVRPDDWRLTLLDEVVRRVAGGVRDWGPILMKSRAGQRDLVAFANVRLVLLHLDTALRRDLPLDRGAVRDLQRVVRRLARLLEVDEQTPEPRAKLVVPAFEHELSSHAMTTKDETVCSLLGRIEGHIQSRVRPVKRDKASRPRVRKHHVHAAPLDAFSR